MEEELAQVKRLLEASLETTDQQREQIAEESQRSRRLERELHALNKTLAVLQANGADARAVLQENGADASEWSNLVQVSVFFLRVSVLETKS
jgi:hypothetical protein